MSQHLDNCQCLQCWGDRFDEAQSQKGEAVTDPYYDGATDALREVMGEIKAAWVISPVNYEDFTSDRDYWREVALEAVQALHDSYAKDAKFMRDYNTKRHAEA